MSIIRTADRSTNSQASSFSLRRSGATASRPPAPQYVAAGAFTGAGVAICSVAWPTQHFRGDLGVLFWECSGDGTTVTPSGWTLFPDTPVVDVADATGSKLNAAWRFAASASEANAAIPNTGDHTGGRIFVFRGVRPGTAPGRAIATSTKTTASTTVTFPAITTLTFNCAIVAAVSRPDDSSSSTAFASYSNANVSNLTEIGDNGTAQGNGGGFAAWTGTIASIADIGTTSAVSTPSTTNAYIVLALEPSLALPA